MKPITILLLLLLIFSGCKESTSFQFKKAGFSVTCPEGWKITDKDSSADYYTFSLQKKGMEESGLVAITWINDSADLYMTLSEFRKELQNNIVFKNSDIKFWTDINSRYGKYETLASEYTAKILKVEFMGILHTFHAKGKTYIVLVQEAKNDMAKNRKGFETIESSFNP